MDYNLTFGQGRETRKLASGDIKSGVRKEDIKDKVLQSLFDKLDNGNGILEEQELQRLELAITEAAAEDGNAGNLSEKEAKKLLKKIGLSGFKVNDLFRFLHFAKSASSKIDFTETNTDNPDEIIIHYNEDVDGSKKAETRSLETGRLVKSVITDTENNKIFKDADNMTVGGNDDAGEYERIYYADGSYTDKYEDGRIRTHNANGSYTDTYEDGRIKNYDADGRLINGKNSKGETWERAYNADGSYTTTWSDGDVYYYDINGKKTHGKNADGIEFKYTYNADGSYTTTCSNGDVYYYDKNGKETHGKLADGTNFKSIYSDDGSLKYNEYTQTNGSKYYYGADRKSFAEKTVNGNIKAYAKQGETFNDTMLRLGITDPADQEVFKKANPKAYKRGYFLLADPGKVGDVYIPKSIADKLDISNILVDETAEFEKHKKAKKKSFGI